MKKNEKLVALTLSLLICFLFSAPVFAESGASSPALPRVVDNADLLTDAEEARLLEKIEDIGSRLSFDIAVLTVESLDGEDPDAYIDDYYDYFGFGYGESRDGAAILISAERDYAFNATGRGTKAFTSNALDYAEREVIEYARAGDYYGCFDSFAELCELFVTRYDSGDPFGAGDIPKEPFNVGTSIVISLAAGFAAALVVVLIMKGKLKTVRPKGAASDYIRSGSLNIYDSRETFLFAKVDKVAIPKNDDSGSGGRISSSGTAHVGRSGKF